MAATNPEELVGRIVGEGATGVAEVAKLFGTFKGGKPVHPSTVARWHLDGVLLPSGRRVHLEAIRLAGRLVTSKAALIRFLTAQQGGTPDAPAEPPRSARGRKSASEKAEAALKKAGV